MAIPDVRAPSRVDEALLRFARALTARPRTVLAVWLVLVAVCTPFALRISDVLSQQGASKVVPGTASASVQGLVSDQFPQRSEREALITLTGWDARVLAHRQLLATLDAAVGELKASGQVSQSVSAFTLHRDALVAYVAAQLQGAGLAQVQRPTQAERARLSAALDATKAPPALAALVTASLGATPPTRSSLAGDAAVAADWTRFPIPVQTREVIGPSGRTATVSVGYRPGGPDPRVEDLRAVVSTVIEGLHLGGTVSAHVTGEIPLLQDTYALAEADNARMEQAAYLVIALVLLLFFRAVLPTVITIAVIGLAMNVSQAWLYLVGGQVHLTQFTVTIMTFVMLGAGIDYSMLLSSRYRQERLAGHDVREATVHATARAGESVLLAGAAVVLSFGATLLSPVDWIPPLGYGGLVGIPIILAAALTITPCLLVLLGDRFFLLGLRPLADLETTGALAHTLRRIVRVSRSRPALVVLLFALLTVPAGMVVAQHPLSADPLALSPDTDARRGADVVTREWGKAALFPTVIAGRLPEASYDGAHLSAAGEASLDGLVTRVAADPRVARVYALTRAGGSDLPQTPNAVLPSQVRADYLSGSGAVRIVALLRADPFSADARATVDRLAHVVEDTGMAGLQVGGATRVDQQYEASLQVSFWKMVGTVSAGVFVLLLVALRSVLIPIRLVLTIMMSNVWAIAVTMIVFSLWQHEAVIDDLPVFLVILMMGLGMDYEIFLITRVRDLVTSGVDDRAATATAVVDTGRVITAAGLVMAGSLGTMMLSSTLMLRQYGLGLGAAVILDATIVRMFFVPASLMLFRRFNWWVPSIPRWASRRRLGEASA